MMPVKYNSMDFEKPHRIIIPVPDETNRTIFFCDGLQEFAERYELDLQLPQQLMYRIYIQNGRLFIEDSLQDHNRFCPLVFLLPADVCQHQVSASGRHCGLHIVLPKKESSENVIPVVVNMPGQ